MQTWVVIWQKICYLALRTALSCPGIEMTSLKTSHVFLGLIAVCVLALATLAHAQEATQQEPDPAPQTEEDILNQEVLQITEEMAELNRLRELLPDIEDGFRDLMQRRVDDKEAQLSLSVIEFSEKLLSEPPVPAQLTAQATSWLQLLLPWLNERLARNSTEFTGGLGDLSALPLAEAATTAIDVSTRISEAVQGLAALNRMIINLESFGVPVENLRTDLIDRVRDSAEMLAVAIEIDSEGLQKLRYRLSLTPTDLDLQTMIRIVDLRRTGYAKDLRAVSNLLADLGLNSSQYRSLVLVVTGDAAEFLDTGVLTTLAKEWSNAAWDWTNANGLGITVKLMLFLLLYFISRALSRLTKRWVEHGIKRANLSHLLRGMIVSTAGNLVLALGVMIALSQMGISLGPLLAGLGVAGFIVGFALQDTLSNFASGMMILIYRPYDVGDIITAAGITGKVEDMSLVYTVVLTFDNQKMIVPNSKIWGDVIQNVTSQRVRRVDLVFGIAYSDDIDEAEKVLAQIVDEHELTLNSPEPMIKLHTLNESSVDFIVRPWVKSADYWDVYWDITRAVKRRFDDEGISIPFPQRDVHHYYEQVPPETA